MSMEPDKAQEELNQKLRGRFKELPGVVQNAITSADVQKQLRQLADTNKLHLDQWQLLENNVMLTLLGFEEPENLGKNLASDLEIPKELAQSLAADISKIVFEPVREELERELEHPAAKPAGSSAIEAAGAQELSSAAAEAAPSAPVLPATPPAPKQEERAARAPVSESYKTGESSSARKSVEDDPYREPPA